MMTSQNCQINVICVVENCLSYNISKFGRKPITGKWDNLNWTKDIMTSLTFICITKMASYQLDVWCDLIVWSHSICIKNLGSIGPIVCEMQNKGNVCVGVCACVCVCVCVLYCIRKRQWHVMPWSHLCVKPSGMSNANITRKYEKLCIVAFNRKFDYDDVTKLNN